MSQVDVHKVRGKNVIRILLVEDDVELSSQIKAELESLCEEQGFEAKVDLETKFSAAMVTVEASLFDLLILDLRDDENKDDHAGAKILERVRQRIFVPVIFHTAHPANVYAYESPLVRVVAKGGRSSDGKSLTDVVEDVLKERLPQMKRMLREHLDGVLRDYMWKMVASGQGAELIKTPALLVHVLARQIVHSLDAAMLPKLFSSMEVDEKVADGKVHPVQMYIYPPLHSTVRGAGDVVYFDPGGLTGSWLDGHWMVLTARCDLVVASGRVPKVNHVVLAKVCPVKEHPKANETKREKKVEFSNDSKGVIEKRDQFFVLPELAEVLPYSYVDFGVICSVPLQDMSRAKVITTLDDPFAAEMLFRHQRFFGRFGTTDLDQDILRTFLADTKPN